ncbi:uroporphyrinogen-III synthase [Aliishimia ponticola]|uniref:Uroporphyrinogen-III synthase n=1 Tax=Aliishimia ponticola TaxID=2499833 RepID=A0A4S4N7U4_9RHOB|nr:uroporphyrinogen-III synthase [Aliishimia ponticola]THH34615.1 uroporphyrinogen-III synthase [Aliishimia ponticola]
MSDPYATVLLTRPADASNQVADQLRTTFGRRLQIIVSPLLQIAATGQVPDQSGSAGVIFTSANGVSFGGKPGAIPAYCVGKATTDAASQAGWQAEYVGDTADALVATLEKRQVSGPLVHIGGVHRRGHVAKRLTASGLPTTEVDVYDQAPLELSQAAKTALCDRLPVIVPLYSPRTARIFANDFPPTARPHLVAISKAVMAELAHLPATTRQIALSPDACSMLERLETTLRRVEAGDNPV